MGTTPDAQTRRSSRGPFPQAAAKLAPPAFAERAVGRPRLVDALVAFAGRTVVLTAPAGYGKSTVAAQWMRSDPRPSCWINLDASDNDPVVLLAGLASALESVEPLDPDALALLMSADADLPTRMTTLRSTLAARRPFVLVIDDVHQLTGPSLEAVLDDLVEHVPEGSTTALLTRGAVPVATSRTALHGDALVVDAARLALTTQEADDLLRATGLTLAPRSVERLHTESEGWAAGLLLASLALRDAGDPDAAVMGFHGGERHISDFFAQEVLPALPADDIDFLLTTAVLDRCSGDLCDDVLGTPGSGAVLERMARGNRFVMPLDTSGGWYRYHRLFADMLDAEMARRDPARRRDVARRASEWFEAVGEPDHAVVLALAADERERAAHLVWQAMPPMQNAGRVGTVSRWLGSFADTELTGLPTLTVSAAWVALLVGDITSVHRFTTTLELSDEEVLPDETPVAAAAALLRALTATSLTALREDAAHAFAAHAPSSPYRAIAAHLEATAHRLLEDPVGARRCSEAAVALGRRHLVPSQAHGLAELAKLALSDGDWRAAGEIVTAVTGLVRTHALDQRPAMGVVLSVADLVHVHQGDRERGDEERRHARALLERLQDVTPLHALDAVLDLAEAAVLAGDHRTARELVDDAERRLRRLHDAGTLPERFRRVSELAAPASGAVGGTLIDPLSPAEMRVLRWLPTHRSFGEIGEELFVSRNTVKSHAMAIYRKLGVTSRSGAVEEAVALGLLPK